MTPEQKRIAIAEACGWKKVNVHTWVNNKKVEREWTSIEQLPDYLNDSNAMREAKKTLNHAQRVIFITKLTVIIGNKKGRDFERDWDLNNAEPGDEADAFLMTIGKLSL